MQQWMIVSPWEPPWCLFCNDCLWSSVFLTEHKKHLTSIYTNRVLDFLWSFSVKCLQTMDNIADWAVHMLQISFVVDTTFVCWYIHKFKFALILDFLVVLKPYFITVTHVFSSVAYLIFFAVIFPLHPTWSLSTKIKCAVKISK